MSCTDVQTIQAGNGTKTQFSFDFPYIFKSEIHVYFWNATTKEWDEKLTTDGTYPWRITDANPTIVEFTSTAPPSTPETGVDNVRIRRITNLDDIRALFNPGSAIRSDDLNNNFEQLRYAIQEANCQDVPEEIEEYINTYYWNNYADTVKSSDTWDSSDTKIATTAALDARFQDEANETITSSESWVSDNDHVATTAAIDARFQDELSETITSSETWPDNDDTIATTAAIDNRIDTAITNDIGTDGTGITVTDDGDGTITLGLANIDLDRIKSDDIITQAEQNADYDLAGDDDSVFTSSAAIRRFENYVQNSAPSGTGVGLGRVWVDVDNDLTLSVWNGSAWSAITSGGTFTEQPNVVYVDGAGGDDANDGHRVSRPKQTIRAAINQINAEINTSVTNGGSGYGEGTYNTVALTGGTGTGLTADIVVNASGVVTTVTVNNTTTLEDYNIGDVLSADVANLGGSGSGLQITVGGNGDGQIVVVAAGTYQETAPLQIKRRNVSVIGQALRSCIVHPTSETELNNLFELNSGSYIANLTLTGMQAGTGTGNTLDAVLPTDQGWNFAFYNNAFITKSPYIQNCTNFSDSEIDNDDLRSHRPRGGQAGDTDSAPTGGGLLVNGATPHADSPLRSMVADSYTHVALNGPGILVTNNGYTQITSSYAFFNTYHIKCLNGGQANLAASTTDFGDRSLVADGRSTTNIFTADCVTQANVNDTTIRVSNGVADASWHGTSTRPASNMLLSVNSDAQIYPITNVVPQDQTTFDADPAGYTGDWIVTISRPDPTNRSNNLGFSAQVATGTNNVQFWLRSMIASSGHTMEYVGSGTNYTALPENGGVPNEARQITESNNGKVWTAITDHNGKFRIGGNQTDDPIFEVDQQLGFVTIPEGSIAFNLLSDTTPQLGGNLDVQARTITTSTTDGNITLDPNGTGVVDVSTSRITNVTDPTAAQDAATRNYVDNNSINNVVEDTTPQLGGNLDVNGQTITSASNGNIVIDPNGTGIISLGSNVGIGTSSPDSLLEIQGADTAIGSNGTILVKADSAGADDGGQITLGSGNGRHVAVAGRSEGSSGTAGYLQLGVRGSSGDIVERLRIDSSGRLLVGTSSSRGNIAGIAPGIQLEGANNNTPRSFGQIYGKSDAAGPLFLLAKHRSDSVGGQTIVSSGDELGQIVFTGSDGSTFVQGATIKGAVDGTPGTNDMPGRLVFSTTADGASSPTERMRIDSSGRVRLNGVSGVSTFSARLHTNGNFHLRPIADVTGSGTGVCVDILSDDNGTVNDLALRGATTIFRNASSETLRIDSSGRLLVGTSTARSNINSGAKTLQIETAVNSVSTGLSVVNNSSTGYTSRIALGLTGGTAVGSNTIVSSGNALGALSWVGADGTNLIEAGRIQCNVDGTPGSNDMPGRLVFSTTADGASTPTERVRIKSNGQTEFSGGVFGDYNTASSGNINFASGNFWEVGGQAVQNPTNEQPGLAGLLIAQSSAPTSFTTQWKHPGGSYTAPTSFPAVAAFVVTAADTILVSSWTEGIA